MESSLSYEHDRSDDDAFEDAPELHTSAKSPTVPTTRVEKTDDAPSHGEVPGTDAYEMRKSDAVPDQLEVVPEGSRSRSSSIDQSKPEEPSIGGDSVPKTIVEKVDPVSPSHGEVPGTEAHDIRKADAEPDEVLQAPESARAPLDGTPTSTSFKIEDEQHAASLRHDEVNNGHDTDDADPGGGFDEFAEEEDDDDFGEFDQAEEGVDETSYHVKTPQVPETQHQLLDFQRLDSSESVIEACQTFVDEIIPPNMYETQSEIPPVSNSFLNERSHSLWSQLVAPPALQPPHWVRSQTRRLFLVSLGVPVDLDEILPASKQKKLILPSIDLEQELSTGVADGIATNESVARLKEKNSSSGSVNRSSSRSERKRKGPPPPPEFDLNRASLLCSTTSEALNNLTDVELQAHKDGLENLKRQASEALEYWLIRRDSANGDKEAFEEVINNLVKHAQKIRT